MRDYIERPVGSDEQTRTQETEIGYAKRAIAELNKYTRLCEVENKTVTTLGFLNYLQGRANGLKTDSWRKLRAAVHFYVKNEEKNDSLASEIKKIKQVEKYTGPARTSARKKKNFPPEMFDTLVESISLSGSKYSYTTLLFLMLSLEFGARPSEWHLFEILKDGDRDGIEFKNAKTTNGRGNGQVRRLWLVKPVEIDFDNELDFKKACDIYSWTLINLNRMHETMSVLTKSQFVTTYKGCKDLLTSHFKKNYPDHKTSITMYSCRHQRIANMKANSFSLVDTAASVGHKSTRTCTEHYGKKRFGTPLANTAIQIAPDSKNINRVVENHKSHHADLNQTKTLKS